MTRRVAIPVTMLVALVGLTRALQLSGDASLGLGYSEAQFKPVPPGNERVCCHLAHGAFEGAFIQFYPVMRGRIPKEALEKALANHDIR